MTDNPDPVRRLLDVVFYAPIGLVLRAGDELPKLADEGRRRFDRQASVARMVGQMAVAQGRRRVQGVLERRPRSQTDPGAPPPAAPQAPPVVPGEPAARDVPIRDLGPDETLGEPAVSPAPGATRPQPAPSADAAPAPDAADLPIPGYDNLSASQVVQRLAGLSGEELEAVRAYEQARRARKTVLLRVAQLRAAS